MAKKKSPKKRRSTAKTSPIIGNGVLANNVRRVEGGRLIVDGVVTVFWAWGFPCQRKWHAAVTVFNLPTSKETILTEIRKKGSRKSELLTMGEYNPQGEVGDNTAMTIPLPLQYEFPSAGMWELRFSFKDHPGELKIPCLVREKPWPEFTRREKAFARDHPDILPSIRVEVTCTECKTPYLFEEVVFEEKELPKGVHRFPEANEFVCEECDAQIRLLDIRGQVRESTKRNLELAMRRTS